MDMVANLQNDASSMCISPIIGIPITRIPATDIATVNTGELPTVAQLTAGSTS